MQAEADAVARIREAAAARSDAAAVNDSTGRELRGAVETPFQGGQDRALVRQRQHRNVLHCFEEEKVMCQQLSDLQARLRPHHTQSGLLRANLHDL